MGPLAVAGASEAWTPPRSGRLLLVATIRKEAPTRRDRVSHAGLRGMRLLGVAPTPSHTPSPFPCQPFRVPSRSRRTWGRPACASSSWPCRTRTWTWSRPTPCSPPPRRERTQPWPQRTAPQAPRSRVPVGAEVSELKPRPVPSLAVPLTLPAAASAAAARSARHSLMRQNSLTADLRFLTGQVGQEWGESDWFQSGHAQTGLEALAKGTAAATAAAAGAGSRRSGGAVVPHGLRAGSCTAGAAARRASALSSPPAAPRRQSFLDHVLADEEDTAAAETAKAADGRPSGGTGSGGGGVSRPPGSAAARPSAHGKGRSGARIAAISRCAPSPAASASSPSCASDRRGVCLRRLLGRLVDPENSKSLVSRALSSGEQQGLQQQLGQLYHFDIRNPTGALRAAAPGTRVTHPWGRLSPQTTTCSTWPLRRTGTCCSGCWTWTPRCASGGGPTDWGPSTAFTTPRAWPQREQRPCRESPCVLVACAGWMGWP